MFFMRRLALSTALWLTIACVAAVSCDNRSQTPEPLISPRLIALEKEIRAGNRSALQNFWRDIEKEGTPPIEPIAGTDQYSLVTFIWRQPPGGQSAFVIIGLNKKVNDGLMSQLLDTDVRYKTYRAGNDLRVSYALSLGQSGEAEEAIIGRQQTDPLNLRPLMFPEDEEDPVSRRAVRLATVELPGAPAQPWNNPLPDVPSGRLEVHRFESKLLDNERRVYVYTPPGYAPRGKPYPLLVLFDGWVYAEVIPTSTILNNLIAKERLPPVVAIMIDTPNQWARVRELGCSKQFTDFLIEELLPWAHRNYHITSDPAQTVIGGYSIGGVAATCSAFQHPEIFGNVLAQSGAFGFGYDMSAVDRTMSKNDLEPEWLVRQFELSPKMPLRFYLEVGKLENYPTPYRTRTDGPSNLASNRHMKAALEAKGYSVQYNEFNGGHDFANWRASLADAILTLKPRG